MKSRCFNSSKAVGTYFCRTLIIHISWSLSSARECIEEGGKKLSPRLFGTVEQYIYVVVLCTKVCARAKVGQGRI